MLIKLYGIFSFNNVRFIAISPAMQKMLLWYCILRWLLSLFMLQISERSHGKYLSYATLFSRVYWIGLQSILQASTPDPCSCSPLMCVMFVRVWMKFVAISQGANTCRTRGTYKGVEQKRRWGGAGHEVPVNGTANCILMHLSLLNSWCDLICYAAFSTWPNIFNI